MSIVIFPSGWHKEPKQIGYILICATTVYKYTCVWVFMVTFIITFIMTFIMTVRRETFLSPEIVAEHRHDSLHIVSFSYIVILPPVALVFRRLRQSTGAHFMYRIRMIPHKQYLCFRKTSIMNFTLRKTRA